jgi:hypothetical protein
MQSEYYTKATRLGGFAILHKKNGSIEVLASQDENLLYQDDSRSYLPTIAGYVANAFGTGYYRVSDDQVSYGTLVRQCGNVFSDHKTGKILWIEK